MAEVRREALRASVAPVSPSDALPLTGPTGRDRYGAPRKFVDRPALRSLLVNRRYHTLTSHLEKLQRAFELDPRNEAWILDAAETLGVPHPGAGVLLDEWVAATPRSFAPYLARATWYQKRGMLYRGSDLARNTSDREFADMREAFVQARQDATRALALRPRAFPAAMVLVQADLAGDERARAGRVMARALRTCPSCYELRALWSGWVLLPRWGGSLEAIEAFAAGSETRKYPRHALLRGFADFERSEDASARGDRAEALAAIDRACALGDDWRFYRQRAALRREAGDHAGRLADLDRADASRPGVPWVRAGRAWALADAQRWEEAGRDLLYVLRSEPTSKVGTSVLPRVVQALDILGWKAHEAGRREDAVRVYGLLRALAPADAMIATRAAAADASPSATGPRRLSPAPVSGDAQPEVVVVVRDATGAAVTGASVALVPGAARWTTLAELEGASDGARDPATIRGVTDAAGTFRVALAEGPLTVVAHLPGPGRRGAATVTAVDATGARIDLAIRSDATLSGRILDRATGVAGVEVLAVPDVERLGTDPRALASTTSGADGTFALRGVDGGPYRLIARGGGWSGQAAPVRAGAPVLLSVRKDRVLKGRVVVAEPGKPLRTPERFVVSGVPFGKHELASSDGRFILRSPMPYATTPISFTVEGFPTVIRQLELVNEETDTGDVVVGPGRRVRGRIVDPDGAPLEQAKVLLANSPIAWTGADGTFEADVPSGAVELEVVRQPWRSTRHNVAEDASDVEIRMSPGAIVRVLALGVGGEPVPKAVVSAVRQAIPLGCQTDATGRCRISGLAPGLYDIVPHARAGNDPAPAPLRVTVRGDGEYGVRVRYPRTRSRLTVRVLDAQGAALPTMGLVFPGAPALADAVDAQRAPQLPHHVVGSAGIENLAPDHYTVVAFDAWRRSCALAVVELGEGEQRELALRLDDGSCR